MNVVYVDPQKRTVARILCTATAIYAVLDQHSRDHGAVSGGITYRSPHYVMDREARHWLDVGALGAGRSFLMAMDAGGNVRDTINGIAIVVMDATIGAEVRFLGASETVVALDGLAGTVSCAQAGGEIMKYAADDVLVVG